MFRSSLSLKFILAFLFVTFIMAGLVVVFVRQTNIVQFRQLLLTQQINNLSEQLVDYYQNNDASFEGVSAHIRELDRNRPRNNNNNNNGRGNNNNGRNDNNNDDRPQPPPPPVGAQFGVVDANGRVLVPLRPSMDIGQPLPPGVIAQGTAVILDGETIATIIIAEATLGLTEEELAYVERTNNAVLFASGISMIVAAMLGIVLTRSLVRPIQDLTAATESMAQGNLEQTVQIRSKDELGQLGQAFNQMSADLAEASRLRRQMTADIAHDLRTPLQVIAGYIESMQDGVLKPTPERLGLIYTEIEHLQKLVDDLRTLSRADAGELSLNLQAIEPADLLSRLGQLYQHRAHKQHIELAVDAPSTLPPVQVDEERMVQVLSNIVSNAFRYTPEHGRISLSAAQHNGSVRLTVSDTGSGIDPAALPHIFDRFYRADQSRHETEGESGLGLAIAKAIVEAHDGTLSVQSQRNHGTTFTIQLPSSPSSSIA